MPRIYITTPIYYVNGDPHLGSAYTMLITDTLARYYRARGWETFYLTGTDEHGDKIAQAAADAGMSPKAFTDQISTTFRAAWTSVNCSSRCRRSDCRERRYLLSTPRICS